MFEVTGSSAGGAAASCGAGDGWSGGEYRTRAGPRAPHDRGRRGGRRRASGGRLPDGPPPRSLQNVYDLDGQVLAERRRAGHVPARHDREARIPRRDRILDQPDRRALERPVGRARAQQAHQVADGAPLLSVPRAHPKPLDVQPGEAAGDRDDDMAEQILELFALCPRQPRALVPGQPEPLVHPLAIRLLVAQRENRRVERMQVLDRELAQPAQQRRARSREEQGIPLGRVAHQAAGSPRDRGSVAAARVPPRAGPPSTSSIAWACPSPPSNGARTSRRWPIAASPARSPSRKRGSMTTESGGAKWRGDAACQRGAATAVATSTPPSTSADTTWAKIAGCASPPMDPWTTQGRPSRNSMPGRSVWSVRLPGASTFGCPGSRLK